VLNLITARHNSHKKNLYFPETDCGGLSGPHFSQALEPLFVPLGCFRVGSDSFAIDHKRQ
jgi:hypothetical protein